MIPLLKSFNKMNIKSIKIIIDNNIILVSTQFRAYPFERALLSALN